MKIPHLCNLETPPLSQENIGHWDPDVVKVYLGMTTGTVLESENTEIKMLIFILSLSEGAKSSHLSGLMTWTPGASNGTRTIDCCLCLAALVSVLPMKTQMVVRGSMAPLVHHLRPLMTSSSPSRLIEDSMFVASEEATAGSVIAKHDLCTMFLSVCQASYRHTDGLQNYIIYEEDTIFKFFKTNSRGIKLRHIGCEF